jgi:hypothetical protein
MLPPLYSLQMTSLCGQRLWLSAAYLQTLPLQHRQPLFSFLLLRVPFRGFLLIAQFLAPFCVFLKAARLWPQASHN